MKRTRLRIGLPEPRIKVSFMYPKGNLFIPASHGKLEAIIKEPQGVRKGAALVCHPHPLGGGTMHNKVVFRVAAGLNDAGHAALRFNFRGVGSSTGTHGELEGGIEDVRDAIDFLAEKYEGEDLTLAGFSFGSRTGTQAAKDDDRVRRLISIGTPVDKYGDYQFLFGLTKPILFVHGDNDEFGSVSELRKLVDEVSKTAETELIVFSDCGHFFDEHLSELREAIRNWMSTRSG